MRSRQWIWIVLCLLLAAGAWFLRPHGRHLFAQSQSRPSAPAAAAAVPLATPFTILSTNNVKAAAAALAATNRIRLRLSNTPRTLGDLMRDPHAILLANALIDTRAGLNLAIPQVLKAQGDPGAYIVQANGPINAAFRAMLTSAGGQIVSYIPNNAYLVTMDQAAANAVLGNGFAVVPYEPYYKVSASLLPWVGKQLPDGATLNVELFPGKEQAGIQDIEAAGGKVLSQDPSQNGLIVNVEPPANWTLVAGLAAAHIVEPAYQRVAANDLSRAAVGVAVDTQTSTNYLGLSGANVLVEVNDSGIDATHPDLVNRVLGDFPIGLLDTNGHGTHVAGIIAGSGAKSATVTNAQGSIMPGTNIQFRGMASNATLYSVVALGNTGDKMLPDDYLQRAPAQTNALISNNSWNYGGNSAYDLAAASYDAAVRDALPRVTGSQPVLFVFSAGNEGNGDDTTDPGSGTPDSILSPGTAKNVITVGAIQEFRNITNEVTNVDGTISAPWRDQTKTSYRIAGFSGRGNVGIDTEGPNGRFKPDVVAPGTSVISTRSSQWDINTYFYQSPTNFNLQQFSAVVRANSLGAGEFPVVPTNTVQATIQLFPNSRSPVPFPFLPIYFGLASSAAYDFVTTNNQVSIPPDGGLTIQDILNSEGFYGFNFAISNTTTEPINLDVVLDTITTNNPGNYFLVYSNLDLTLGEEATAPPNTGPGPYYRYETGTSMAAADVSGVLALIQDYLTNTAQTIPSPALLKALLIIGARPTGAYDLQVQNNINFEGWGLANLPGSLPPGITNRLDVECSSFFVDQSPTNALATGDKHTYQITISTNAQQAALHLRVTLAWTDPPGDPAAAIKLVNNLDLVVTNLDDPNNPITYYGNDIGSATIFNTPHGTNSSANLDAINNVENVFVGLGLGTNYTITVIGRDVNVNAVTAHTNNVVQDYALVIACGEGEVTNAMTVADNGVDTSAVTTDQDITFANTNQVNAPVLNQLVGASTPLLGTNTQTLGVLTVFDTNGVAIPVGAAYAANAQVTVGMTNQWHFYVATNPPGGASDVTNAGFITFIPDTLSVPRMGVFAGSTANATTPEADIDLYVTTDPTITNLNPAAISNCVRGTQVGLSTAGGVFNGASLSRLGTEFVVDIGSKPGQVYYIGVYSERQKASEYGFLSVFTSTPFSQMQNGNQLVNGLLLPVGIPDGSPAHPGIAHIFGLAIFPMTVGQVLVNDSIYHNNYGDLIGTLYHNGVRDVLNNHDSFSNPPGPYNFVYDDFSSSTNRHSDGPGSLLDFVGTGGIGLWRLGEVDNAPTQIGFVTNYNLIVVPHKDLTKGITVTVQPGQWFYDFVDVPVGYTNLTVTAVDETPTATSLILGVKLGSQPTLADTNDLVFMNIPVTTPVPGNGNSISIGPPLKLGRYFVGVFNPDTVAHTVYILATLAFSPEAITTLDVNSAGPVPLLDDAVTTDQICVSPTGNIPDFTIQDFRVGLQVDHARISDLVFHLISPDGTRYLLMESRGTTSTNGAGLSTLTTNVTTLLTNYTVLVTNVTVISNNFESVLATDYLAGATVKNWVVTTSQVSVVADPTNAYTGTNFLALASGGISYTLPPTLTGGVYTLTFACRGPGIVSLWRGESNAVDSINGHNGTFLSDPRYVTNGEVGQDFYFTGAGSPSARINVTDSPDFILTNAVTIEAWVWASNVVVGSQGGYVLFRGDDNPGLDSYFLEIDHSSQVFYFRIQQSNNAGGWSDLTYNFTPYLSQWVHVAGAWDARSRLQQLYINGLVITQAVTSIIPVGTLSPAANPGIGIGNNQSLGYNTPWRGHLDEVSLYRRALSASEIKAIYQRGSAGKFDPGYGFSTNLAEAQITVSGATNIIFGNNTSWQVYSVTGQTPTNGAALTITGLEPGMLLDTFVVTNVTISASNVTATLFVTNVSASTFYLTFTENTNLTTTPIKFAAPPFVPVLPASTNGFFDGFETVAAGDYTNGQAFSPGWTVISNQVSVITDPTNAYEGNNFLALAGGVISNTLPTLAGQTYTLSFAYRGPGIAGLWRGESNEVDSIYGNNGTIVNAGYTNGVVGRAFELDPENWPVGTYNAVDVPDDPRYILTNSLSIEGWIRPRGDGFSIFWRGDNRSGFDPYFLSMQGNNTCSFYIEDAAGTTANVGVPLIYDQWWHVAGTLDGNTGIMTIYTNGVIAGQLTTALRPFGNLNPGLSPGVGIGNVNDGINNFPFWGDIDEISLYGRALSASEINAIYQKGSAGKYSAASFAGNLAEATVNLPGAAPVTLTGNNTTWQLYTTTFTATQNGTPLQITGLEPGMLLDAFGLTNSTVATNLYYLPEQDMSAIKGQSALGCWTLEVQDDRAGATNDATLVSWQLGFTFANTNLPPPVPILPPGVPITNVVAGVAAGDPISWFQVNVPANATAATNRLIWATAPVSLLYSTNNPQTTGGPGDAVLIANSMGPAANVLTPATVPALVPGGSYYLGVQNNNGFDVTNVIEVDFDIPTTVLTGGQPVTNTLPGGGLDYYSVTVPTNADFATNLLLFGTGPLNLLFNQSAPPTGSNPGDFTLLAGVTSGSSVLSAGSTPPLVPGQTYYLGVRNPGASSVTYALQVDFHLVPPPVTTTNVVWTLINVPTNADWATNLLVSSSAPVSVWWSTNNPPSITNANDFEMIPAATNGLYVLGTNTVPAFIVPGGSYWLGVENTNGVAVTNDVQVHFHLVLPPGPILISSITPTNVSGTFGFQLTWYAPTNDVFMVQWTPKIAPPVVWNTFTNIITYKLLTPTNGIGFFEFLDDGTQSGGLAPGRFYRLRLLGTNAPPVPTNNVVWTLINVPTNADWATNLLVSSSAPVSVWWSTNNPPSVTNANDFEMIPAATNGLYVLGTNTVPAFIVPGGSYWLGVENTNGFGVTNVVQVKFHLVPPPGPVPISSITPTNASGTLGFRLTWYGPTNNVFMVQWTPGIAPPVAWHTFTNIITYTSLTPTNGIGFFEFIDDGSQSGGLAPGRYYRLRQLGLGTNTPPVFVATPPNQTILAYSALAVTNNAVDAEAPPQTLTYSLPGAPAGATISGRGVITWTPTLAQANTTNRITTVVTDNGLPPLSVTNRFTVIVPPSLLRPPAAFTLPATFVTGTSARLSGFASPNGSPVAAWFEWGSNQLVANQTAPLAVSGGTQVVWLTNALAGLADGQAYYFRLVVSNQVAVARGAIQEFGDGSVLGWGDNSSGQTNAPANLTNAVAIAGGEFHTVALAGDGTVTAWGDNTYNQTNIPAGLSGVVAVAAEAYDNLALTGDGAVVAWGDDTYNQTNVPAGLNSVVAVACGAFHNLALKTDGTVVAWGDDTYNQTNIPPGLSNVVAVAAGWYHSLALRNDGTVAAWGYNYYGQAAVPAGLSNVVAVAAGVSHSLALKNDGTAVMWGDGSSGQTNVSPALSGVLAIACGDYHSLALKSDGTMTAWGYSVDGETNVPPGLDKVVAVAGGGYHSLALRAAVATPLVIPAISSVLWTNNSLVLEWTAPIYETFHVQWAASIAPPVSWNTFPAIVTSTNGVFTFADTSAVIGVRFYRLALP